MPTTSRGIWSPNDGDAYDLTVDLAAMANSVDDALVSSANMYVGTAAQRAAALSSVAEGSHWQDTAAPYYEWVKRGGVWQGAKPIGGVVTTTGAANATRSVSVTFPAGYFSVAPVINLSAGTGNPENIEGGPSYTALSATGVTIRLRYKTASSISVAWTATPV